MDDSASTIEKHWTPYGHLGECAAISGALYLLKASVFAPFYAHRHGLRSRTVIGVCYLIPSSLFYDWINQ